MRLTRLLSAASGGPLITTTAAKMLTAPIAGYSLTPRPAAISGTETSGVDRGDADEDGSGKRDRAA